MKNNDYEWHKQIVKKLMMMRGFIGSMEQLTKQVSMLTISVEDYITRTKIVFEEYEKQKGEIEK